MSSQYFDRSSSNLAGCGWRDVAVPVPLIRRIRQLLPANRENYQRPSSNFLSGTPIAVNSERSSITVFHKTTTSTMAKNGDTNGRSAKRVKPNTANKAAAQSIPSFDESALSALTEKIEKGFGKGRGKDSNPAQNVTKQNQNTKQERSQASRSNTIPIGKKRDRAGYVKPPKGENATVQKPAAEANGASERDTLLKEILEMGGSKEDLDLMDIESEDEVEGGDEAITKDPKFAKEFQSFMAGLGLEGQASAAVVEDEEEEEAEIEEDEEDSEEESDAAEESAPKLVQTLEKKQPEKKSNDANRLVSNPPVYPSIEIAD